MWSGRSTPRECRGVRDSKVPWRGAACQTRNAPDACSGDGKTAVVNTAQTLLRLVVAIGIA